MIWEDILNIVVSNGIFATLFVFLLMYLLKDSSKREKKYTDTISSLNRNLNTVDNIEEKIDDVKTEVGKVSADVKVVKKDVKQIKKMMFTDVTEKGDKNEGQN